MYFLYLVWRSATRILVLVMRIPLVWLFYNFQSKQVRIIKANAKWCWIKIHCHAHFHFKHLLASNHIHCFFEFLMNFLCRCEVKVCHVVGWSAIQWMIKEAVRIHSLRGLYGWQPRIGKWSPDLVMFAATLTIIFNNKSSSKCAFLKHMTSLDTVRLLLSIHLSYVIH